MCALLLFCTLGLTYGGNELLHNSDFESSNFSGNWVCNGCSMKTSTDAYHGAHSVMVTNRGHDWGSPKQTISVTPGHTYTYRTYIKLLNTAPGHMYHNIDLMVESNHASRRFHLMGRTPMQQEGFGWTEIGGDFTVGPNATQISFYVQIDTASVNFMQDYSSARELQHNANWKQEAHARINSTRTAPISVQIHAPSSAENLEIDIIQTKSTFAWGTALDAGIIVDPNMKAYQDFVYNNFEWATLHNSLKWRLMEWTEGHSNYNKPTTAIAALRAKGLTVRGHNMFWGVPGHIPAWVDPKSASDCLAAMKTHVNNTMAHTKGTLAHWDVTNENLHGDYFEKHTGHANISMEEFRWMHQQEPNVKLFLNEYNVVTSSQFTTSYKMQGKAFKDAGVPIYGLGVQSHFHSSNIDMDVVKFRLDKVAEAGLPIWITEMTITDHDANKKAEVLDDLLTLYFSHPAVEGVILWGFWNQHTPRPANALAEGNSVTPNEAGVRYHDLVRKTWRTNVTKQVLPGSTVHTDGYFGEYELNIKQHGHVIHTEKFSLDANSQQVDVHLGANGGGDVHVTNVIVGK